MSEEFDVLGLIQSLPLFAKVKAGAMKKMYVEPGKEKKDESPGLQEKHVRFQVANPGEVIVRQGEFDTEFYIVIEGIASAYRTESDGRSQLVATYGNGDFFGEMSAISHQARSATVKADAPTTLMRLDVTLFQQLFEDKASSFAEIIDGRYRERALAFHLMTAPIFKTTSKEKLDLVARGAELVSFEKDQVITTEGAEADAVYLVRCGIVKRSRINAVGIESVHDYLCDNSSFGEQAVLDSADDRKWRYTGTAMSHVDLVKVPCDLFRKVFADDQSKTRLHRQVNLLLAEEEGVKTALSDDDNFELLVANETVKGTEALVIDLKRCTRCNACVESCVAVHEDKVPRLSKRGIRDGDLMLSSACYNCKIPECMLSCKFGAIRRDKDGQIHIIVDNCSGCSKCESGCPYGVIRMAHILTPEERRAQEGSIWDSIPLLNKIYKKKAPPPPADDGGKKMPKAIKCDLCAGLPFEACVYNCPCSAISRQNPEALKGIGTIKVS
ncbi:MAG: cyclic nucleotide-binding domain-containing protein [Planctomycetes bacterium]|nr:cyclic nucleotide-binding domain-containing protein [Planctomycetota bacterium]